MADARFEVPVQTFPGRFSNIDPHDLPAGATQIQDNIHSRKLGQLDVRDGIQATALARAASDDIVSLFRFDRPDRTYLVWHTATGKIQAANTSDLSTVLDLGSGYSSFQPVCFAQDRRGVLYGVNGIQSGFRWDGLTAALESLGMDPPGTVPTVTAVGSGGALSAGDYSCAYRWLDDDTEFDEFGTAEGGGYPTSFSPLDSTTAVANDSFNWTGLVAPTNSRVTKVELWRTTADQSRVYYRLEFEGPSAAVQTYIKTSGTFSAVAAGPGLILTVPSGHGLVVNARITIPSGAYAGTYTVSAVGNTTVTTATGAFGSTASGTWTTVGYYDDDDSDDTVAGYQNMSYFSNDGSKDIANRFVPPPSDMPYIAFLQDRMFMAGTVEYTEGTVATTSGSTTITGTSTLFSAGMIGSSIYIGNNSYKITAWSNTTSITVQTAPSSTVSGLSYKIIPPLLNYNRIMFSEADEPESMPVYNDLMLQQNQEDNDKITGLAPNNSELIVGQQRHLYAISYHRQPDVDANPSLIANRGMLNNRCWARYDNSLFILDSFGVHVARGGEAADAIGDLWREEQFSSTNKYFFAVANRARQCIRFHVNFSETGYPKRWLEVRPNSKSWTTGTYTTGLGAGTLFNSRIYYGSINRRLLVETPATYLDHVNARLSGSPTSSTTTVVTNSGASFTDSILDSPVAIVSGTGKGQVRYVTARSGTTFTVDTAYTTTPDTTSVYSFGAIPWALRTGVLENGGRGDNERNATEDALAICFEPTSDSTGSFDVRRYLDHSSSLAVNNYFTQNLGDYITAARGESDVVIGMYRTTTSGDEQSGYKRWRFGGRRDRQMESNRYVTFDMRGFCHGYPITIYSFNQVSVE